MLNISVGACAGQMIFSPVSKPHFPCMQNIFTKLGGFDTALAFGASVRSLLLLGAIQPPDLLFNFFLLLSSSPLDAAQASRPCAGGFCGL
jgi:hypothetical protein